MNPNRHKVYENGKSFMCDPTAEGFTERDCVDVGDGKRLFVGTQKSIRQIDGPHGRGYNNPSLVIDVLGCLPHQLPTSRREAMLRPFAEKVFKAANDMGMKMAVLADIRPINEKQVYEALRDAANHMCKFVFIITPDTITSLHKSLNLWEREFCMVVQSMKSSNFGKVVRDNKFLTLEIVINKTNIKLGGLNCAINLSAFGNEASIWIIFSRLIVGIGMSHPPPAAFLEGMEVAAPTVVGYSANSKSNSFEFVGDFVLQEGKRTSTLPVMDTVLENTLDMYKDQNKGTVPKEIIIYRSGADEGSYALVISEEIPHVRSFLAAKGTADVKLVFIVAQKEHNVRLFKQQINPADKPTQLNVLPGTVVDVGIAHPSFKEFYLNSHTTLQGSASTPPYSVLVDDLSMTMNELEGLTFAHDHQIVALTTSLPAPVYIANRYAERGINVYAEYMATGTAQSSEMGGWKSLTKKLGLRIIDWSGWGFIANQRKERCVSAMKYLLDSEKDFFGDKDAANLGPTIKSTVVDKDLTDLNVFVEITKSAKSSIVVNPESVTSSTANRQLETNDHHITQFLEIALDQVAIMNPIRHKVYENGKSFMCNPMAEVFTEMAEGFTECVVVGDRSGFLWEPRS